MVYAIKAMNNDMTTHTNKHARSLKTNLQLICNT